MGASGWSARVPYQEDIAAALQQARQRAYEEGDFYRDPSVERLRSMSEEEYVAWGLAQVGGDADPDQFRWLWQAAQTEVTGPDSLLASQPESGTHSIIDMTRVSDRPAFGAVAPVPVELLQESFGTTRPTVEAVEKAIDEGRIYGFRSWCGMYLIGYRDDQPAEIFFVGYSGD